MLCPRCNHALDDHTWGSGDEAASRPCSICEATKGPCRDGQVVAYVAVGTPVTDEQIWMLHEAVLRGFDFNMALSAPEFNRAIDWLCETYPKEFVAE